MITVHNIWENGIIGAGGAGFPTHKKYSVKVETIIVNAAECEPLLHKDAAIIEHYPLEVISGLRTAMTLAHAQQGLIAIKSKHRDLIEKLIPCCSEGIKIVELGDYYPAGDEFVTVYECTGKVIPPGGLPLHVGVIVQNVETIFNIARNQPVTHKFVTVGGWVKQPVTLYAPVGTPFATLIEQAGGPKGSSFAVLSGGVMMGKLEQSLDRPLNKTTGGILVFPQDHQLIKRYTRPMSSMLRINRSACDQCYFCTQLCPRYLLGHPISPHLAMRSLAFKTSDIEPPEHVLYCSECNLCSLMSCPEGLDPKDSCVYYKAVYRQSGNKPSPVTHCTPHPLRDERRMPVSRLLQRLDLLQYDAPAPLATNPVPVNEVKLVLQHHIGKPAKPVVTTGQLVSAGEVVAEVGFEDFGARLHASITGRITVTQDSITIMKTA